MTLTKQMKFKPEVAKEKKVNAQARIPASLHTKVSNALAADGSTWQNLIETACKLYLEERNGKAVCPAQK